MLRGVQSRAAVRKHPCGICRRGRRKGVGTASGGRTGRRGRGVGRCAPHPSDRRQLDFQRLEIHRRGVGDAPRGRGAGAAGLLGARHGPRHRPRGEGTHLRRVRAFEFGAGSRRIRVGAVDRRPSREVVGRYDFARKPSRRGEQIHRVGPRRRSGGRECGCRSRRVCAPGGTARAAGRRRSPATRNDRRDVPPCRDRMRELPISRVCRQTRRREPFRFGADRFADAVGRRVRRAGGGARGRSRAESGRRVGARGPGRCGFRGPGFCGVPPQAVHLQRTDGGDTGGLRQRGDRPAGRGPGDPIGGRGRFYGSDGLCRGRSRGGAKHPALVCRTDGGKLRGA